VQAATVGLVTIRSGTGTSTALVTKAGQLQSTMAGGASLVTVFGFPACSANGFYTIPAGKALIITGINFYNIATGSGPSEIDLTAGPISTPCQQLLAGGLNDSPAETQSQTFQPGIPIPAGDSLGAIGNNQSGSLQVYGYLVPAAAVPANALQHLHGSRAGRAATIEPRH
jgi:hypothetical protein